MTDQQTSDHSTTAQASDQASAPAAHPFAARPWFKYVRVIVPSAVILLVAITVVSTGGGTRPFDFTTILGSSKVASPASTAPATGTLGQSVRDGRFSFVVTSIQRPGKTLVSRSGTKQTAEGAFVVVRVNVTNIGYEPGALTATDQFLVSSKGQRFATSSAISSLTGSELVFKEKLNPGSTVSGAPLLFDVPAGTSIASIEFHDSLSSTGVKVKLP
ncbi:MAG: hypothetical protein QOE58_2509 [Actinomycetota bacterium]|jgi:hypothetical protein|nr:hypothetical protein [Actinomycetota bacterium]